MEKYFNNKYSAQLDQCCSLAVTLGYYECHAVAFSYAGNNYASKHECSSQGPVYVIVVRLNWGAWDAWSNAPQLTSYNYFVPLAPPPAIKSW